MTRPTLAELLLSRATVTVTVEPDPNIQIGILALARVRLPGLVLIAVTALCALIAHAEPIGIPDLTKSCTGYEVGQGCVTGTIVTFYWQGYLGWTPITQMLQRTVELEPVVAPPVTPYAPAIVIPEIPIDTPPHPVSSIPEPRLTALVGLAITALWFKRRRGC